MLKGTQGKQGLQAKLSKVYYKKTYRLFLSRAETLKIQCNFRSHNKLKFVKIKESLKPLNPHSKFQQNYNLLVFRFVISSHRQWLKRNFLIITETQKKSLKFRVFQVFPEKKKIS